MLASRSETTSYSKNEQMLIEIFNIKGQKIETLECNIRDIAETTRLFHSIEWNAEKHSSGIYFVNLIQNGNTLVSNKITLLK